MRIIYIYTFLIYSETGRQTNARENTPRLTFPYYTYLLLSSVIRRVVTFAGRGGMGESGIWRVSVERKGCPVRVVETH